VEKVKKFSMKLSESEKVNVNAYDESETNCINVENANGVQYLESPESPAPDPRSESEFEASF
jgi:hypothetical protein